MLWEVIPYRAAVRVDNWESGRAGNPMVSKAVGSFFVCPKKDRLHQPVSNVDILDVSVFGTVPAIAGMGIGQVNFLR